MSTITDALSAQLLSIFGSPAETATPAEPDEAILAQAIAAMNAPVAPAVPAPTPSAQPASVPEPDRPRRRGSYRGRRYGGTYENWRKVDVVTVEPENLNAHLFRHAQRQPFRKNRACYHPKGCGGAREVAMRNTRLSALGSGGRPRQATRA